MGSFSQARMALVVGLVMFRIAALDQPRRGYERLICLARRHAGRDWSRRPRLSGILSGDRAIRCVRFSTTPLGWGNRIPAVGHSLGEVVPQVSEFSRIDWYDRLSENAFHAHRESRPHVEVG